MFPTTHIGRIIGVSASIMGIVILALLVTSVTSATELTKAERNVGFLVRVQSIHRIPILIKYTLGQIAEAKQKKSLSEAAARIVNATVKSWLANT